MYLLQKCELQPIREHCTRYGSIPLYNNQGRIKAQAN